ncbi:N-acetylmuramoyl-L-alanine amidase [candidate division WOR-3 bacterium]|nr:N-acetylmuramoyl-L-alanine amidase [candidate division WOR-3 bacterium]
MIYPLRRIVPFFFICSVILRAGTVNFSGKSLNTLTYNGNESVTLVEFASKLNGKWAWVPEKKKAVLVYNDQRYIFTANNRTVVIGEEGAVHLPLEIGWDGTNIYIPVTVLDGIFKVTPSEVKPSEEIEIEKIYLSGADPTTIEIVASGPISCEVKEMSSTSVNLKIPVGSRVKQISASGLVSSASLTNSNKKTTIELKLSKPCKVSSKGIPNGVEITFTSTASETVVTQPQARKKLLIVVDPGHGGKDPGAIGKKGTKESEMVLDVSKRLKKLLEAQGHTVLLTREEDKHVPLADRTKFANQKKADLFLSIHFNANNSSSPNGFETYFLGSHRLEYAKNVALRENASLKYDIGEKAYDPDEVLNDIIATLLTNKFQKESEELAGCIQDASVAKTGFANRGLNQAGFYVLKGCSMPAVLVEGGFLSNPSEEAKIRESSYRQKVAEGIAGGVSKYVNTL